VKSISEELRDLANAFAEAGIESAQADAELLLAYVLDISRGQLQAKALVGENLSQQQLDLIDPLASRRIAREPLQHLTGIAYFRRLELSVGRGVFVPRPETEFVVQLAIDELNVLDGNPIAIDLGTGSGAIALAMATEVPHARVFAVEKSTDAFIFTRTNFERYESTGARLVLGDLADELQELNGTANVVVSNPPYIPTSAVPRDVEVRDFDPELALYGGEDGMSIMHLVSASAKRLVKPGGLLVVEHADSQGEQVRQLLLAQGWSEVIQYQDLTGRDRAVTARR
jgi:release factor glutamine methyltransferase